ncbi:MAG: FAD-dependent oxidoreductase [Raoultibacter sp.]
MAKKENRGIPSQSAEEPQSKLSRRSFLKGAGAVGVAAVGVGAAGAGLIGCSSSGGSSSSSSSSSGSATTEYASMVDSRDYEASLAVVEPITDFADEKTYDIVVVGAGVAGVPAVLTALDEGVTVACLQKEPEASANGHYSAGLVQEASNPVDILKWQQSLRANNSYRLNWDLLSFYTAHSGETAFFIDKWAEKVGSPADETWITEGVDLTEGDAIQSTDTEMELLYVVHGWKDGNDGFLKKLAKKAEEEGAEFFYNTPGVQLIKDGSGKVTGVVGQTKDGDYIKFTANKGVILATGDYENNQSMVNKFNPDLEYFEAAQLGRAGDGHLMAIQAGASLVPLGHCKQLHCVFASDWHTSAVPLLSLDMKGKRFMNEEIAMTLWHNSLNVLTDQEDRGVFVRVFDDAFETKIEGIGTREMLEAYIPDSGVTKEEFDAVTNYTPSMADMHKADTLDELASILGVPADALKESVAKWNEYCAAGEDPEFGLDKKYLKTIDTPPYWGVNQHVKIIAINSGVVVDKNYQVVDGELDPIPGLFAVGTTGGDLCGNNDWRMSFGLSNGHCMTGGRYATLFAIHGEAKPTTPVAWDEVKSLYGK